MTDNIKEAETTRSAMATAKKEKAYRSPLRSAHLFEIDRTRGWTRWGIRTSHSLEQVTDSRYLDHLRNKVKEGDEVIIQIINDKEWLRLFYIITQVDPENHKVWYFEADRIEPYKYNERPDKKE